MQPLPRCLLSILLMCSLLTAHGQDLRTGVPLSDGTILAAGECIAWLDAEGNVLRKRISDRPFTALATDGEQVFALDSEGRELLELNADGEVVTRNKLPVQGRLRDLSLDGNTLWAVTDAGEIVHGNPASEWTVLDFNDRYEGYYPRMDLRAVAAGGGSVMVAGMQTDGKPAAYTSSRGTVWSERTLDYTEMGVPCPFTADVAGLYYDAVQDRFYLLGGGGSQLALPGCSHCNSLTRYPVETLYARIPAGDGSLLLGSDGFVIKIN